MKRSCDLGEGTSAMAIKASATSTSSRIQPPVKKKHIMEMDPMFPRRLRKSPPTLLALAESSVKTWLIRYLRLDKGTFGSSVRMLREHIDRQLIPELQTGVLRSLVPSAHNGDGWKYSCQEARKVRLACKAHRECKLVYRNCDRVVRLLLSKKTQEFRLDLRRVDVDNYRRVSRELTRAPSLEAGRGLFSLRRLVVCGGTVHSDQAFYRDMESMCRNLMESAPNLEELHLPICTNHALRSVSDMPKLKSFHTDRTRFFNRKGLWHLCHPRSMTRANLERLHFGVFKHHHFNKMDCSKFLACMRALKSLSFRDEERQLIQVGSTYPCQTGDKVLAYSVLKLAIVDYEQKEAACPGCMREACRKQNEERKARGEAHIEDDRFKTKMVEIKVVDRNLKPEYLLEACPDLSGLYLDWQEEQALPPFNRYLPNWFSDMLRSPRWDQLCSKLTNLEIVFPSAHTPNSYSLTLGDLGRLLSKASNLKRLKLVGAGRESPVPLIHILLDCPNLVELHLEKTSIHVPDNYEVIHKPSVNHNVRVFRFLGDMTSLLMNEYLTRGVAHYMPGLRELEVQPESAVGYAGMSPKQMRELSKLKHLERLSLPLSIRSCEMNMPELVYVLSEMSCLRFLVLSWGKWCNAYDMGDGKISHMMRWLFDALDAENADIHLQLSYNMHPGMFTRNH